MLGIIKKYAILLLLASCLAPEADLPKTQGITVDWQTVPSPAVKGPIEIILKLTGSDGQPLPSTSKVSIEANMTHPGMVPVLAEAQARGDGTFAANLTLTMRGDWVLFLTIKNEVGIILRKELPLPGVR